MVQYRIPMTDTDNIEIAKSNQGQIVGSCGMDIIIDVPSPIAELADFEVKEVVSKVKGRSKVDDDIEEILSSKKGGKGKR